MPKKLTKKESLSSKAPSKAKGVGRYYEAVGRRKKAIARVRLFTSGLSQSITEGNFIINNKPYKEYFPILALQKKIENPFLRLKSTKRFKGIVKVKGGGPTGQAEAVQHGIARALVLFDDNFRKKLKKAGYLKRDPRKKERKKFGLKKARRAPQWRKR
jgi:small subunit ribosomal protein S9